MAVPPRAFLLVSTGLAAAEWAVTSLVAAVAVPPALPPVPAAALLVAAKFALAAAALAAHGHWFCASRLCVHPLGVGGGWPAAHPAALGGGGVSGALLSSGGGGGSVGGAGGVHGVAAGGSGAATTAPCRGGVANGVSPSNPPLLPLFPTPTATATTIPPHPPLAAARRRIIRALLTAAAVDAVTPVAGAAALFVPRWGSVWAKMAAAAFLTSAYLAVVLVLHGRVALLWVRAAEAVAAPADGGGGGGDDP